MKLLIVPMIIVGLTGFSFGGDCANGFCNRPSSRSVSPKRVVSKEVVRLPRQSVNGCKNGNCNVRSIIRVR